MKRLPITALCAVALTTLTACGSSGSATAVAPTYTSQSTAANAMQSQYTDANGVLLAGVTRASTADINASPNATYTGYISGDVGGEGLVGTLIVNADFGAGTATNSATGFIHENDGAYAGTLTGAGVIQPTAPMGTPQISTALNGTLSNGGVDYATSLGLDGNFAANGTDPTGAVAGEVNGTLGLDLLIGLFVGEN